MGVQYRTCVVSVVLIVANISTFDGYSYLYNCSFTLHFQLIVMIVV